MRLISIKSLKANDVLAAPIYTAYRKMILNAGANITENHIKKLKEIGIKKVYVKDSRFEDVEIIQPIDFATRDKAESVIKDNYISLQKKGIVDEYALKDTAKVLVDYIRDYREKGVSILSVGGVEEHVIEHSLNVGILSAFLGNQMSYNYNQLCDLVAGAIIHDLGRENKQKEDNEHIQKGFDVLRKCRGLSLHSSIVCYEHHENFDGSGFPRSLKGTGISEFSRVIRIADMYDYILQGNENNNVPLMPHEAFECILSQAGKAIDGEIVTKFRDTIIFYPNGCTVGLEDGRKGIVIKQNMGAPQRPVLRLFDDEKIIGEVNLLKELTCFIKDVLVI